MREKMYSRQSNSMLHDHIIDGFHSTHEGLQKLKEEKLISKEEYTSLLEKNIQRLVQRVHEWRVQEGLVQAAKRLTCIYFALFFAWAQVNGDDLDMRRSSRTRATRSVRQARRGRRLEEV